MKADPSRQIPQKLATRAKTHFVAMGNYFIIRAFIEIFLLCKSTNMEN